MTQNSLNLTLSGQTGTGTVVGSNGATLVTPASLGVQQAALNMNSHQINSLSDPTIGSDAANKSYVDTAVAGLNPNESTEAASTVALTATYDNGASGVGATLTNAGAMAAISLDGVSPTVGQRVLIKNQASTFQNGVYDVTVVGDGATNWVLTRSADFDTPENITASGLVPVLQGSTQGGTIWLETATVTAVGTDPVTFVQFGSSYVTGPGSATDRAIAIFNGTTGKIIQNSNATVSSAGTGTFNTVSIGLGGNSVASNTAIGVSALAANAGAGSQNVVIGWTAAVNSTGISDYNVIIGSGAVQSASFAGSMNTLVGRAVGTAMTSADSNCGFGMNALLGLTTGDQNIAIGQSTLGNITGSSGNIAIGYIALNAATTSTNNIAIGTNAMALATTPGVGNVAIGNNAMGGSASFSGSDNTGVGHNALTANTSGSDNTAIGYQAGVAITTGGQNTILGSAALASITTQSNNTAIGFNALLAATASTGNIAIGQSCLAAATGPGDNNTIIGTSAADSASFSGTNNVGVGFNVMSATTSAGGLVAVGRDALNAVTTGSNNIGIGALTGTSSGGTGSANVTTGTNNTFIGNAAGGNAAAIGGTIAIGALSVATVATGATSGDDGPGIAIGSVDYPVGFRGDATIYPTSGASAGFWLVKVNGTQYKIELFALA